jgi:hypothetical protein
MISTHSFGYPAALSRRPCERRDPYAAASRLNPVPDGSCSSAHLWLWVPAFAGTTMEDSMTSVPACSDVETSARIPAAQIRPDCACSSRPSNRGRRECRARDAPAASHAVYETKHTSIVTTVTPETAGIPRAMVLRLPSCSPRRTKPDSHRRHRHWVSRTTRLLRPQRCRPSCSANSVHRIPLQRP